MTPGRLIVGALLLGAIIAAIMAWQEPEPKGVWFGISIFVFGWIITAAVTVRDRIKRHTFDLILRTRFEETYLNSARILNRRFKGIDIVNEDEVYKIDASTNPADVESRYAVTNLLNFYEVLSISVYYKDADEKIVKEYFYDLLITTYQQLQHFVSFARTKTPHPTPEAFVYLEWLYKRWAIQTS